MRCIAASAHGKRLEHLAVRAFQPKVEGELGVVLSVGVEFPDRGGKLSHGYQLVPLYPAEPELPGFADIQ